MAGFNDVEILLVEDNLEDAELTLRALTKNNLANGVFHVKDGAEALEFLFASGAYASRRIESAPRVVLLDLKLPKVDGLEVLQQVKADKELKVLPVVVLTSSREEKDMLKSYQLGVNAYVVKPVDFHEFVNGVKELGIFWAIINEPPPGSIRKQS